MLKHITKPFVSLLIAATIGGGFAITALPAAAQAATQVSSQRGYVVQLKSNNKKVLQSLPGVKNIKSVFGSSRFYLQSSPELLNIYSFSSKQTLEELSQNLAGEFEFLQMESKFQTDAVQESSMPNDPGFTLNGENIDRQWGLVKANFIEAWKKTTGNPEIVVAVVDTGIDATHEDFEDTRFVAGYNAITDSNISRRANSDDNGHGTMVAGVIAASTDNDTGIAGAAYSVSLMSIKALDSDGSGSSSNIAEAIIWAADHGADVINLSLGGIGFAHDTVLANSITYAFNKNVVIVSAAGNDVAVTGGNLDKEPVFPICSDNGKNMIIGVTATDSRDLKPEFANYGKACVDVSAPGKRILSTINHDPATGGEAKNAYAYASGTSLSVPLVSAQAGLLRSLYPFASNRQIRDRIISTAANIDNLNLSQCAGTSCRGLLGGGRIDVARSLEEQILEIEDGDLVQVSGTTNYYYINGGKRQPISPFVRNQRFRNAEIKVVSFSEIESFPEGSYAEPLNGTLVKIPNDPTIYYMHTGLRRPLTYQVFTLRNFDFMNVVTLTNVEVQSWIEGSFLTPPDGTIIRTQSNPTVYWTVGGVMHPVNYNFFIDRGLNIFPIVYVPEKDLEKFPKGEPYVL